jgi:hypothetical protein
LGLLISVALFVPLLHPTLFEALGRSRNAPVVSGMYGLVGQLGPALGYALIAVMIGLVGGLLGWAGIRFAKLKDRLYEELGLIKYSVVISLLLMMVGVLGKIVLRLLFGIKYLISLPMFNFNI